MILKVVRKMKNRIGRLLNKRAFLMAIIVICGLGLLLIGWQLGRQSNKTSEQKQVTADEVRAGKGTQPSKPATASSACKLATNSQIAKAVNGDVSKTSASIPDSKTANTSLAGCVYSIKSGPLRSFQVIVRNGPDADTYFTRITKSATKISQTKGKAYIVSSAQVIKLNDGKLITITAVKRDGSQNIDQQLTKIADLY